MPLYLRISRTAQAATRGQKRECFKKIGLARSVLTSEDNQATLRRPCQTLVITKISEDEPVYTQIRPAVPCNQTRIGMST